jgi:hypothetical protein
VRARQAGYAGARHEKEEEEEEEEEGAQTDQTTANQNAATQAIQHQKDNAQSIATPTLKEHVCLQANFTFYTLRYVMIYI